MLKFFSPGFQFHYFWSLQRVENDDVMNKLGKKYVKKQSVLTSLTFTSYHSRYFTHKGKAHELKLLRNKQQTNKELGVMIIVLFCNLWGPLAELWQNNDMKNCTISILCSKIRSRLLIIASYLTSYTFLMLLWKTYLRG